MIGRLLGAAGIDAVQWRTLVRAYLVMDLRRTGGAMKPGEDQRSSIWPIAGLLIMTGFNSITFAFLAYFLDDVFTFCVLLTSFGALITGLLLMVDFTGLVVSPDDYWVLGTRPVDSRTYFAARLSAVLVYIVAVSLVFAWLPALVLGALRGVGLAGFGAVFVAVVLCDVCAVVVVIALYAAALEYVHPRRLTRALSYLQLAVTTGFLGSYALVMGRLGDSGIADLSVSGASWIWFVPTSWFAALIPVAAGIAEPWYWVAALGSVILTAACFPLAAGRFSLEYAERLAELNTAGDPSRPARRSWLLRLPAFGSDEARAIAMLIRAQFRYDMTFRLAVLTLLPLTAFYLIMGWNDGAVADPFSSAYDAPPSPLYFGIVLMPLMLHSSLQASPHWRAAWIFFALPANPARLIVAAKNIVSVWFLGGYLVMLAGFWSYFYDRVWHAVVHAFVLGVLAHLFLQVASIVRPGLPFAMEPRQAQRSSQIFGLMFFGSILAGVIPLLLPWIYARPAWFAGFLLFLFGVTGVTEYFVRLRAREAVLEMEFRS